MRIRYDPNNVLMLPMPQENFKIIINILIQRDLGEYDEEKEDAIRAVIAKDGKSTLGAPFRAFKLHYCETDYNFYGVCKELYEEAASYLKVDISDIDLFVQYKNDGAAVLICEFIFILGYLD